MSIGTKDLRDIFDDARKRASEAISDAKIGDKISDIEIGKRDTTPGLLYFSLGLLFGAIAGVVIAFLMTPVNGEQARQKLQEQMDRVRRQREEFDDAAVIGTNGTTIGTSSGYDRPPTS